MYVLRPGIKQHPQKRWALPDRVFFACGACHILAYAFLETYRNDGFAALWIKPANGFTGNHIIATNGELAFDYHGYSELRSLVTHMHAKAKSWWPGWHAEFVPVPTDVLISEEESTRYDGLWLREPEQFLHDALPRARHFLHRFGPPPVRELREIPAVQRTRG